MKEKSTNKKRIHKIIVNALRETIRAHGLINTRLIGSAAKRITSAIFAREKKESQK